MSLGGGIAASGSSSAGWRYVLTLAGQTIGGGNATQFLPLDTQPLSITLAGPGTTSQMSFTAEDINKRLSFVIGMEVQLTDNASSTGVWFTGVLVNFKKQPHPGGRGVMVDCIATGKDWYLDHIDTRTKFKSKANVTGRNTSFTNDDDVVRALLDFNGLSDMAGNSANIARTTTDMDAFDLDIGLNVREGLDEVCDQAQPGSGTSLRRYYVDARGLLHWYSGTEGLNPPARIADGSYLTNLNAASGVVSVWTGRVGTTTTLVDEKNYATATLSGGYTQNVASLCLNEQQLPAVTLNGSSGYATASGANLHQGDTWTWGIVFKRSRSGQAETLISAGTNDVYIGFDASDHLIVQKEGTGNNWVSGSTYTSTTLTYHVIVTRTPGTTLVYVNGTDITAGGTTTARTFAAAGAGAVNIGRKLSTTDTFFKGTWWGAFVSSSRLTAGTSLALFNQWFSLTPENLEVEIAGADIAKSVYIKGTGTPGQAGGVGYGVIPTTSNDPYPQNAPRESIASQFGHLPRTTLDRADSTTAQKRNRIGYSYLLANNSPTRSISFEVTYDPTQVNVAGQQTSFRPGQLLVITDNNLDLSAVSVEIKQVDIDPNLGSGQWTFKVTADALPWSALRRLRLKQNRGRQ